MIYRTMVILKLREAESDSSFTQSRYKKLSGSNEPFLRQMRDKGKVASKSMYKKS